MTVSVNEQYNLGSSDVAGPSTVDSAAITDGSILNADINAAAAIAATKLADGSISDAEFEFLNNVTSNIQTQLNNKDASGAAAAAQAASLQKTSNLSDVASVATSVANLGLGTPGSVGVAILAFATLTAGALLYGSAANTPERLAPGAVGTILQMGASLPAWTDLATAGVVAGTGAAGRAAFWNATATQSSDANYLFNSTDHQLTLSASPVASANTANLMIGSGGFAGGGGTNFSGSANGTHLAINCIASFAGNCIDVQSAGAVSLFKVRSVASAGNGFSVEPSAAGSTLVLKTLSTGSNESLAIDTKGTGSLLLRTGGTVHLTLTANSLTYAPSARASVSTSGYTYTGNADTTLSASTEVLDLNFNLSISKQWATGALGVQRDVVFQTRTNGFVGASVLTMAVGVNIVGSPGAGTNNTTTTSVGLVAGATNVAGTMTAYAIPGAGTVQNARSIEAWVQTNATNSIALRLPSAPQASANTANLAIGSGAFNGSTTGFFVGSANGTQIGVNAASGYTGNLLDMQVAGVSSVVVTAAGNITAIGSINLITATGSGFTSSGPSDVTYGTAGSFSTIIQTSGVSALTFSAARDGTFSGNLTFADAKNFIFNTTTGTKIGTATTQKIAFYNATPIVQGTGIADATGGVVVDIEARAALNALISRIEATGLIATV